MAKHIPTTMGAGTHPQRLPASQALRFTRMLGDSMAPTIAPNTPLAVVPAEAWAGDGLYLMELVPGSFELRRCAHVGRGVILCRLDNPAYSSFEADLCDFERWVIGQVSAICHVVGPMPGLDYVAGGSA